jgi:hypothetical protein
MSFFANLKAKRAAKKAKQRYEEEFTEWESEKQTLTQMLDIFTKAAKGEEPNDQSLVQKNGELVLWTGTATFHEAGRTSSRYVGGSQGFSIPIVAGIRYRVSSTRGTLVPGEEMQMDRDQGFVKLTNQRLIFAGNTATTEWAFSKLLSTFTNPAQNDYNFGVSNRKKTSGLRFSPTDGPIFGRIFAMTLYAFEEGIPAATTMIKNEIKEIESKKPALVLESTSDKKSLN